MIHRSTQAVSTTVPPAYAAPWIDQCEVNSMDQLLTMMIRINGPLLVRLALLKRH